MSSEVTVCRSFRRVPDRLSSRAFGWWMVALLTLGGVSEVRAQADSQVVVARVDGQPITSALFTGTYVDHLIQTGRADSREARLGHLNSLIDGVLLAAEARGAGLEDEAYRTYVDRKVRQMVGRRYFEIAYMDSVPAVTEADMREAFRRGKERRVLRHLLFKTEAEAQAAYARLEHGADFVALANEVYGTAAFDSAAGSIGAAEYWDLDDAFAEAAWALPMGGYSIPVRSRYGWHIIRLEGREFDPILTEDEFQYRSKKVRSRVQTRRVRLGGDRFVRGMMDGLDVQVKEAGVTALAGALRRVLSDDPENPAAPKLSLEPEEVRRVQDELTPETVLASYTLGGEVRRFTAADYYGWIEELPYSEIKSRPAASVGRALRNEVLAVQGLARGLHEDGEVLESVRHYADGYLANRMLRELRSSRSVAVDEAALAEGFQRLGYDRVKQVPADYWIIPFSDRAEAEAAREALTADPTLAGSYTGFRRISGGDLLTTGTEGGHLRQAPLREAIVFSTAPGAWFVARVDRRTPVRTTLAEVRPQLEQVLSVYLPEMRLLKELRAEADIYIDTGVFEGLLAGDGER